MNPPPKFDITPTQEQLDAIERELSFQPAEASAAKTLSTDQVERFNRDGYLKNLRIFSADEIDAQRSYFDELLRRVIAEGGDSYSISSAHLTYGPVYDLLTHPKIVACVCDLLGENVIGWGSHYFCKMPGDGKTVAWHQDASYWPLTPSRAVTVWLAIDKADRQNACMRVIPGSHLHGHVDYRRGDRDEHNTLDQTIDDVAQFGQPIDVELEAGEISMHSDLLLHGSDANDSERRRCGLTLRYTTADVQAHLDWNQKGVVVAGCDVRGHWSNAARPGGDLEFAPE